jgi:hypothetical protein
VREQVGQLKDGYQEQYESAGTTTARRSGATSVDGSAETRQI